MRLLENRTAIITGGATRSGIGFATGRLFAEHGARVALFDLAEADPQGAASALGGGHLGFVCDVRDPAACRDAVAEAADALGSVDVLIGNAGVVYGTPVMEISQSEYDEVLDVNLRGNFNMAQAAVPHLRAAGGGAIVSDRLDRRTGRRRALRPFALCGRQVGYLRSCQGLGP